MTEPIPAPFDRYRTSVRPEWIDNNGHMNMGYYVVVFDLPLALDGTPFQVKVWRAVAEIPYGQTRAYGEVARRIRRPNAVRAVGAANGQNPLPIVIPCHRVIGSNGSLTGYGGGLPIKRALLALESRQRSLVP